MPLRRSPMVGLLLAAVLASGHSAAAYTVSDLVLRHQTWLDSTENFRANVTYTIGAVTHTTELVVDYRTDNQIFQGDFTGGMPVGILNRIVRRGREHWTEIASAMDKPGFPTSRATLADSAFEDGSDQLFQHGSRLERTLDRMREIGTAVAVTNAGRDGIRIDLDRPAVFEMARRVFTSMNDSRQPLEARVAQTFDEILGLNDLPQALTIWIDLDGRIESVDITGSSADCSISFDYQELNMPIQRLAEVARGIADRPPTDITLSAFADGSPRGILAAVEPAELFLDRWPMYVATILLLAASVVIAGRALRTPRQKA
jgi:hypothetical protein